MNARGSDIQIIILNVMVTTSPSGMLNIDLCLSVLYTGVCVPPAGDYGVPGNVYPHPAKTLQWDVPSQDRTDHPGHGYWAGPVPQLLWCADIALMLGSDVTTFRLILVMVPSIKLYSIRWHHYIRRLPTVGHIFKATISIIYMWFVS